MSRENELNEFASIVNALQKKYNVKLAITIEDLSLTQQTMSEEQVQEQAPVAEPVVEPAVEQPAVAEPAVVEQAPEAPVAQ